MLSPEFCETFGTAVPIWNAGMGGGLAGVELAAAVSTAGGLGVLGMGGLPTGAIGEHIHQLRSRTDRSFGVNLIMPLMDADAVTCCLDEAVPVLILNRAAPHQTLAIPGQAGAAPNIAYCPRPAGCTSFQDAIGSLPRQPLG